jgi:pentatricopeptide repeat domain-containing protein 1
MALDQWDVVVEVLERMKEVGKNSSSAAAGLSDDDDDERENVDNNIVHDDVGTALLQNCATSHPDPAYCAHNVLSAMKLANLAPTIDHYATTIQLLCRHGPQEKAGGRAGVIDDWWKTALVLRQEAALLLTEQGDLPMAVYEALVESLARAREWKQVVRIVRTMESDHRANSTTTQPSLALYRTAIECCVNARQADLATQLLLSCVEMTKTTTMTTTANGNSTSVPTTATTISALFETVVVSLCQQLQWRRALTLLETMDRLNNNGIVVQKTRRLYHALLTACARAREPAQAKAILVRMRQRDQLRPDIVSFNAVMSACVGAGLWKDALAVLDQIHREPGVLPDLYTYTNALRACAKGKLTTRAITLLEVIRDKGMKMDAYCYTAAMEACGDWRKALELLQEMQDHAVRPTEVTYSVLIKSCGAGGQWEKSLELLNGMRDQGMQPNLFVYNAAITAIAKAAKKRLHSKSSSRDAASSSTASGKPPMLLLYREIDRLMRQMEKDQIEPDGFTYTSAISCYGAEGQWEEAMALMDRMQNGGPATRPNRVAYTAAMASCATANQPDAALRLFQQMKEQGVAPDIVAYNALFAALRAGRCSDAALRLWDEMMGRTNQTDTTTTMTTTTTSRRIAVPASNNQLQPDIITLTE